MNLTLAQDSSSLQQCGDQTPLHSNSTWEVFKITNYKLQIKNLRLLALAAYSAPARMFRMTPADFRRLALALEGAEEGSHMGAADFRVGGRIFATLAAQDEGYGNLM